MVEGDKISESREIIRRLSRLEDKFDGSIKELSHEVGELCSTIKLQQYKYDEIKEDYEDLDKRLKTQEKVCLVRGKLCPAEDIKTVKKWLGALILTALTTLLAMWINLKDFMGGK